MIQYILFLLMILIGYGYARMYGKRAEANIRKLDELKKAESGLKSDQEED